MINGNTYRGKPAAKADRRKLFDARAEAATGRYALPRSAIQPTDGVKPENGGDSLDKVGKGTGIRKHHPQTKER